LYQTNEKFSASSFYPGRGDTTHPLASLDPENQDFHNPNVDNGSETEDDDEEIVDLSLKNPARFSEIMATEVSFSEHLYCS
jgi:hypothetical protein